MLSPQNCPESGSGFLCLGRSLPTNGDSTTARPFARPPVGVRALAADGQSAAMAEPAIRTDFHEPLDVERDFLAQVAFDSILLFDGLADLGYFIVVQLTALRIRFDY